METGVIHGAHISPILSQTFSCNRSMHQIFKIQYVGNNILTQLTCDATSELHYHVQQGLNLLERIKKTGIFRTTNYYF